MKVRTPTTETPQERRHEIGHGHATAVRVHSRLSSRSFFRASHNGERSVHNGYRRLYEVFGRPHWLEIGKA